MTSKSPGRSGDQGWKWTDTSRFLSNAKSILGSFLFWNVLSLSTLKPDFYSLYFLRHSLIHFLTYRHPGDACIEHQTSFFLGLNLGDFRFGSQRWVVGCGLPRPTFHVFDPRWWRWSTRVWAKWYVGTVNPFCLQGFSRWEFHRCQHGSITVFRDAKTLSPQRKYKFSKKLKNWDSRLFSQNGWQLAQSDKLAVKTKCTNYDRKVRQRECSSNADLSSFKNTFDVHPFLFQEYPTIYRMRSRIWNRLQDIARQVFALWESKITMEHTSFWCICYPPEI